MKSIHLLAGSAILLAAPLAVESAASAQPSPARSQTSVKSNPLRDAYYGDLHIHTTNSFDVYALSGVLIGPDEAYKFARGDAVDYLGQPIMRREPLDFLAVTDHAELLGVFNVPETDENSAWRTPLGRKLRSGVAKIASIIDDWLTGAGLTPNVKVAQIVESTWRRTIRSTNDHYIPGKFTTFVAYEWTSAPGGAGLHRNIIFRGNDGPSPFTAIDSARPEDLWNYLDKVRMQGYEALAIPHNSNVSNGLMFDWNNSDGRPIDQAYAEQRAANEPLLEISQNKGTSETHPSLSSTDEFANFEILDQLLTLGTPSAPGGSYARDAVGRGLVLASRAGANPFKYGFIGGSDLHGGLSISVQADYAGNFAGANLGKGRPTREQAQQILTNTPPSNLTFPILKTKPGSLMGAWAESNTRESLYDAFRRKEVFATSGTRLKFRFFGGWNLNPAMLNRADWVRRAYTSGVPMGGDLPAPTASRQPPKFLIWAVKDPGGANLDRVQVVKLWLENGRYREKIYDAAYAGRRRPDPKTGKLPPIGNTVNIANATYTNSIGAVQLKTFWRDPDFNPDRPTAYYLRVVEIPTPRWTALMAARNGLPIPAGMNATTQERGWSSPIWYMPAK